MDKTKVIWIGRKCFCKEKLDVKFKLEWGNTELSILGQHFSTNLKDIPYINFSETLRKIRKEMGNLKSRFLTPFGRITLIKTLFLPKLIHLFMSLPVPNTVLQEINRNLVFGTILNYQAIPSFFVLGTTVEFDVWEI